MFTFKPNAYDKHVYETELQDFLPDKIIDAHVHIWDKTRQVRSASASSNGGSKWTRLVAEDLTGEDLIKCNQLLLPGKEVTPLVFGSCSCDTDIANDMVLKDKERFGFPALYRTSYEMTGEELEKAVIEGGYLGLKPYLTFCPPYIPAPEIRIFDFLPHHQLEVCNKHGWIVMLHIARDKRLRDKVNVAQLMEIEERYPNIKLIVAHIGRAYAKEDIGDAFETLGKSKNMLFDFTANVCDDAIRACIEAVGPKRLLFGTDLPIALMRMYRITENGVYYNVVPRGLYGDVSKEAHMRETDEKDVTIMYYEQIRAMRRVAEELKLTRGDIEDIFYNNAKRLLGR
ncbi:MAG: amidohydrolase [Ruminococcaceae bacterium]|nr:amidohydrolase [Oscillospiraceae bacterium]